MADLDKVMSEKKMDAESWPIMTPRFVVAVAVAGFPVRILPFIDGKEALIQFAEYQASGHAVSICNLDSYFQFPEPV